MTSLDFAKKLNSVNEKGEILEAIYAFINNVSEQSNKEEIKFFIENISEDKFTSFGNKLGFCRNHCIEELKRVDNEKEPEYLQSLRKVEKLLFEFSTIYQDVVKRRKEAKETSSAIYEKGAWQVFCFGPGLISDGNILVDEKSEVAAHKASNPRTAIGYIEEGHYVMVVSDGRTTASAGLSLYQLALVLEEYGVKDAYNLDGGGSSVMIFNGKIVNQPTSNGEDIRERSSSDIVYIGY